VASQPVERFFLVGFMGAGKSTVGEPVAKRLGIPFVDLDERIESSAGMSVAEIFAREGESGFRDRESREIAKLVAAPGGFLAAAGGGAFAVEQNRRLMKASAVVVWLDVSAAEILRRIDGRDRPLFRTEPEVRALHEQRRATYQEAQLRLPLDGTSPAEAVERLHQLLLGARTTP
jgi:shikimate kinase